MVKRKGPVSGARPPAAARERGRTAGRRKAARITPSRRHGRAADEDPEPSFPIVGIGASAGGLDALSQFFAAVPDAPNLAFVVVQHLDPTKRSLAPELLNRHTSMEVAQVEEGARVAHGRVYVIPPNRYLSIAGGVLRLSKPDQPRGARMAIDFFLRSLAEDQQHRAVGVILSGTGTDGTLGIKAIKAAGGLVLVQDPDTAEYPGMPRSAIDTGVADHVLPPARMPEALVPYADHPYVREPAGRLDGGDDAGEASPGDLGAILALLRSRTRHDFHAYRAQTLVRRTRRRMCLRHLDDYGAYLEFLRKHPGEVDALASDLLITVTDFFRDEEAWEELRTLAVAPLIDRKLPDEPIRVWVPACATGEEPYSLAMLLLEELHRAGKGCPLQIFASDVDGKALDLARAGRYPKSIAADVTPGRLARFFTALDGDDYYRVNKSLRDSVVFAEQNLISDPPFSKVDLVCCRNVLIYLRPEVQERIIALFHFALVEGGVLFLGSAETVGRQSDLFRTLSKRWRIYRRLGPTRHDQVQVLPPRTAPRPDAAIARARREARPIQLAQQRLLDVLAPRAVLVDREWRIRYICGDVDAYLSHSPGVPSHDLLGKARPGLRAALRGAVHTALEENRAVTTSARIAHGEARHAVKIVVRVIHDREEDADFALVVFDEEEARVVRNPGRARPATTPIVVSGQFTDMDEHAAVRQLEDELATTKEELQAAVEQFEVSNEEFKASNEEVLSVNEELQSTNEELETSKEELQSLNEELSTVNSQLAAKVEEAETKRADLENLLFVTDVPTICLGTDLTIRWFTPAARQVLRLQETDKGRPLLDLTDDFVDSDLTEVAAEVLHTLTAAVGEVACRDGRAFVRRVLPYRTEQGHVGGIVITLFDITERKRYELELHDAKDLGERIIDTIPGPMLVLDADLRVVSASRSFYDRFQLSSSEVVGRPLLELGDPLWRSSELLARLGEVLPGNRRLEGFEMDEEPTTPGRRTWLLSAHRIAPFQLILLTMEDITERRAGQDFIRAIIEASPVATVMVERAGRIALVNSQTEALFGYTRDELLDKPVEILIPPPVRNQHVGFRTSYLAHPEARPMGAGRELYAVRKDGTEIPVEIALSPVETAKGPHVLAAIVDITKRKRTENELTRLNESLERQVAERVEALRIVHEVAVAANEARTAREAIQVAIRRICQHHRWPLGHCFRLALDGSGQMVSAGTWHIGGELVESPERMQMVEEFQRLSEEASFAPGGGFIGSVLASGEAKWLDDVGRFKEWQERGRPSRFGLPAAIAFPVKVNEGVAAILEFFSSTPVTREPRFREIITHVAIQIGHAIEREGLDRAIAEATSDLQRRLGRDLHDSISQELTGIGMLAESLRKRLVKVSSPLAGDVGALMNHLQSAHRQVRRLSRGLMPVDVDAEALMSALEELSESSRELFGIPCAFVCSGRVTVEDNDTATHLYRIAQEALQNAVKHGKPTHIEVLLETADGDVRLSVRDDGGGLRERPGPTSGTGRRIMQYRAGLIGGALEVESRPGEGVTVVCTVPSRRR